MLAFFNIHHIGVTILNDDGLYRYKMLPGKAADTVGIRAFEFTAHTRNSTPHYSSLLSLPQMFRKTLRKACSLHRCGNIMTFDV